MVSLSLKHVEELALMLPVEQREELIARLNRSLPSKEQAETTGEDAVTPRTPKRLYGDWKGTFPEDFDIDAALREIRKQWTRNDAA